MEHNLNKLMELQDMALGYRDDRDEPTEFAKYKTTADLLKEAKYLLSTYFEWGHMNEALKEEEPKIWRSHVAKLKRFIARLEKEGESND